MSKIGLVPVVEWSQHGIRCYDPNSGVLAEGGTVAEALAKIGSPRKVGLALARSVSFVKVIHLPDVPKEDALRILQLQAGNHFPTDSAQMAFDFIFIGPAESEGRPALAAAVKVEVLERAHQELKQAGAAAAWTRPVAVGSQFLAEQKQTPDALILEETPSGLALDAIAEGRLVYSRSTQGSFSPEMVRSQVARTLAAAGMVEAQVILAGEVGYEGDHIQSTVPVLDPLAQADVDMDIVLPSIRAKQEDRKVQSRRTLAVLAFAACIVYAMSIYLDRDEAASKLASQRKKWTAMTKQGEKQKGELTTELTKLKSQEAMLTNSFQPAQSPADVLTVVANNVPQGVWLTGVTIERGQLLQIRGTARQNDALARYVDSLNISSRFRDVRINYANNAAIDETPVVQFSVSAHVIGNLPLIEQGKRQVAQR